MSGRTRAALPDARDVALVLALMAVGLALRLAWFSGWGLGDDLIYRDFVRAILERHTVLPDNTAYRVTWWFPTAFACRLLGLSEAAMIAPVTIMATLGIGLVYAFGKALWGRAGGVIAALLLVVHPLDFAWSTMLASDVFLSFFSALTMFLVLRALSHDDVAAKRRSWVGAAASLWLAYHAKVSAILLIPAVALVCWRGRRRIGRDVVAFVVTATALFASSALVAYVIAGDPIAPYHAELSFQGLLADDALDYHRLTSDLFWTYPRIVFAPDQWGDLIFSVYPHLLIALFLARRLLGMRTSADVFLWLLFLALGMQFNLHRIHGDWVAGFRNIRHLHLLVYPIVLLLAGYLATLRLRRPRLAHALLGVLLAVSGWQSVSTAMKTHVAFADRRRACWFLASLPAGSLYTDLPIETWASILPRWPHRVIRIDDFDQTRRRVEIAVAPSGYLVTGGAREPHYGCNGCLPLAEDVSGPQWTLLREFPGPAPTPWRPEPLRIWQTAPPERTRRRIAPPSSCRVPPAHARECSRDRVAGRPVP